MVLFKSVPIADAVFRVDRLPAGDCFALENPRLVIVVRELPEAVLVVRPASPREWALWGYCIGNSHQPLMIADDALVCAELPGMEQVLSYHAIPFTRDVRPFTPVSQAPGHHEALT